GAWGAGGGGCGGVRFMGEKGESGNGARLVPSGIDGVYPAGLPVATVARIERDAAYTFARIVCQPAASVESGRYVLVLKSEARPAPPPDEASPGREKKPGKTRKPRRRDGDVAP